MASVKTAISLDALLLEQIDALAAELKMPRSRLLAQAAEEFLRQHENAKLLADLNRAHADGPTPEEVDMQRKWKSQYRHRLEGEW